MHCFADEVSSTSHLEQGAHEAKQHQDSVQILLNVFKLFLKVKLLAAKGPGLSPKMPGVALVRP